MKRLKVARGFILLILGGIFCLVCTFSYARTNPEKKEKELNDLQERFKWWPTDATPGPVKDEEKGGYWWWPTEPGTATPWGNRGYIYVYKIIFDYKEEELPPPKPKELRPSLLIKKIHKNVKIYFDYDSAVLRSDAKNILEGALKTLKKNPEADILITGNCDRRGSEAYNTQLGRNRALAVKNFMLDKGIFESRIRIISRGKLDAVAPVTDLVGMQKDRNAHFMIAEVEEVMIPYPEKIEEENLEVKPLQEGKYLLEKEEAVESAVKVSVRKYTIKKNDSLWSIAKEQLGSSYRWKYLYEFNKDKIKNPNKLEAGTVIDIPVEREDQRRESDKAFSEPESVSSPAAKEPTVIEKEVKQQPAEGKGAASVVSEAAQAKNYTIKKNDSLWKIAKEQLGDGNRWREIYELNKDVIKNPDRLKAGKIILLPQ